MTPEEEVRLFKGLLAEAGVVEGKDYMRVYFDRDGVVIENWKPEYDAKVGRAFELLAKARGDDLRTIVCGDCWAEIANSGRDYRTDEGCEHYGQMGMGGIERWWETG